jgi:molybdopterin-binding protein
MKVSAGNQIKGKVVKIVKGDVHALVTLETEFGQNINATVTVRAMEDLDIKEGKEMVALIKSTQVMLGVE